MSNAESTVGWADPSDPARSSTLKDIASAAGNAVKQEAADIAAFAQDKFKEQIEERRQNATASIGDFANAIRKAGDDLASHDQTFAGRIVKQAADGLEGLSRSVLDKRPDELLEAVRSFGRNNPVAFIGGAALLGLALGRVVRSAVPAPIPAKSPAPPAGNGAATPEI